MSIGESSYSETSMAMQYQDGPGQNINPVDYEGLLVRFMLHAHRNPTKSREAGRPIYDEVPYVDVRTPGDRTSHLFRPAAELDKRKWPKHWAAFESRTSGGPVEGTPLEEWPQITRGMVEELKFFNVFTVEALADLNDSAQQNFMGIGIWIQKAQAFLVATDEAKAAEQIESKDRQISDLTERLEALETALQAKSEED